MADSRSGIYETWDYGRAFPYTGMLTGVLATQNNSSNEQIFSVTETPAVNELESTSNEQRYFPYISGRVLNRYQVGGSQNGQLLSTNTTNYTYDSYGNATNVATTLTDEDGSSPYSGQSWTTTTENMPDENPSTWCLDLLSETQVSYTASIGSSVTRTKQFTPDTTHCRYTQITTEPSSPTYEVTEALAYDGFGNVSADTVTGINMAARQTNINWGATGQFPMSVTDPTGATTNFNYNFNFGLLSSVTDPNGLAASLSYDGFGRKQWEQRTDGTWINWEYNNCSSAGGCLLGANTLALTHSIYDADKMTLQSQRSMYFDELERPIISEQPTLSGNNRVDIRYDSLGRMVEKSDPCFWSSVTTPCTYWTTTSYDLLNRPIQVQRPISSTVGTPQTTTYTYSGPITTITDPQGNTKTTVTDVNGWLRGVAPLVRTDFWSG